MAHRRSRSQVSQASLRRKPPPTVFCQASPQSNLSPNYDEFRGSSDKGRGGLNSMLFLTRWFGVTASDAERNLAREQSDIKEITERVLLMQAKAAAQQRQPLRRGTHAKGVCARAQFEVFDVTIGHDPKLAARLARGMFVKPSVYPA